METNLKEISDIIKIVMHTQAALDAIKSGSPDVVRSNNRNYEEYVINGIDGLQSIRFDRNLDNNYTVNGTNVVVYGKGRYKVWETRVIRSFDEIWTVGSGIYELDKEGNASVLNVDEALDRLC